MVDSAGAPIPFARVFVENTNNGAVTNLKGYYQLELDQGSHNIVFNNIEFNDTIIQVELGQKSIRIDMVMTTKVQNLKVLTVKADDKDPAYAIIRKTIANKKKYQKQLNTYSFDSYIKCTVEKEYEETDSITKMEVTSKKHLNFVESISTTHFEYPNKWKQHVKAYNNHTDKSNVRTVTIDYGPSDEGPPIGDSYNPYLFRQNTSDPGFNFYDNLIHHPSLGSTPYVSPISTTAMLSYHYKLVDSWMDKDKLIYKILVTPRRLMSATFTGHVFIEEGSFALTGVDLEINPKTLYLFKTFNINHQYEAFNDTIWLTKKENYYFLAKEGKADIFGKTQMIHTNHVINPNFPKNFFKNELKLVNVDAYEKDTLYWSENRALELKTEELKFIRYQDSMIAFHNSEAYLNEQDSIYNRVKVLDFLLMGVGFRNWTKKREIFFDPLIAQPRPFGVGGYRHVLPVNFKKEWQKGYAIDVGLEADYGFKNRDLKGGLDAKYTYLPKRFGKIHFAIEDGYRILNSYESLTAFFSRSNYVRTKGVTLGHSMEFLNGFYADIDLEYSKTNSIANIDLSAWSDSLFGELNVPRDFDPFTELYLDVKLTFSPGQKYYNEPYKKVIVGTDYPKIGLWYKRGIKDIAESVVDFDFLELHVFDDFQIGTLGESKWDVHAGKFVREGNIMLTDYKYFRGSDRFFFSNPLLSFQLLGPSLSTTSGYLQANYIHHFNGALMNKVPLINRLKLQSVGGAGILMLEDNNFKHVEFFVGLEKPFRLFKELFKVGVYFVGADSNHSELDATFKIGIDFFNAFTKKWSY